MNLKSSLLLISTLIIVGCETPNKSVGVGGAVGAGTGALIGGIADPGKNGEMRTRNVLIGATLGGMTGLVAGSLIHKQSEKDKKAAFLAGQKSAPAAASGSMPALSTPRVETNWVEGRVQGNRYIEGHFEYVIVEPARWDVK